MCSKHIDIHVNGKNIGGHIIGHHTVASNRLLSHCIILISWQAYLMLYLTAVLSVSWIDMLVAFICYFLGLAQHCLDGLLNQFASCLLL